MKVSDILDQIGRMPLTLCSEDIYERYRFFGNGQVAATLGSKSGAVTAPMLKYTIVGESLVFSNSSNELNFCWDHLSLEEGRLLVNCSGALKVYDIDRS